MRCYKTSGIRCWKLKKTALKSFKGHLLQLNNFFLSLRRKEGSKEVCNLDEKQTLTRVKGEGP